MMTRCLGLAALFLSTGCTDLVEQAQRKDVGALVILVCFGVALVPTWRRRETDIPADTWVARIGCILAALFLAACDGAPLDVYPGSTVTGHARPRGGCVERPGAPGVVPLQKRKLTVPLAGGLGSNIDDKLLPNGRLIELQNARVGRLGEIIHRDGTAALSTGLLGTSDTLPQSWALGTLKDCLVSFSIAGSDHPVNSYSPTAGQWATDATNGAFRTGMRGPIVTGTSRVTGLGNNPDLAYSAGYYFVAYRGVSAAGLDTAIEAIIDATTGRLVAEKTFTDVTAVYDFGVRVVNGYAVFCRDTTGNDLKFDRWQISNLDAGPTTTTFTTTTGPQNGRTFDMLVKDSTTISVAYIDGVDVQCVDFVPSTGVTTAWTPRSSAAANIPIAPSFTTGALNWMQDLGGSGKIALITQSAAQGVLVHWDIPTTGATRQAVTTYTIDAAAANVANVVGHTRGSSATGEFTALYDDGAMRVGTRTGGVLSAPGTYYLGVALRSKTWQYGSSYYVIADTRFAAQSSRYVLELPPSGSIPIAAPLAMAQMRMGIDIPSQCLSAVVLTSAGSYVSANSVRLRLRDSPINYTPTNIGVELLSVSFKGLADTTTGAPREAIDSLFTPGGTLGQFDGTTYAEAGFAYYPEQPTLTPNVAGANTYWYKLVYSYPDVSGRVWRSADSIAKSVGVNVVLGGGGQVTVACPTLRLTGRADVIIEVYRGAIGDSTTFQKVGTVNNSIAVNTVNFVDTVTDATLANGEFLYTNGVANTRPLANDAIPGFSAMAVGGNRLFGISNDDPQSIWVSNKFVDGQGLRFSEQNKFTIRDDHGPLYGLAAMPDGRVIAFKSDAVYTISGDGPNPNGQGSFSVSTVAIGLGTINPRSIVETSEGPEFLSTSERVGIFRINVGLSEEYVGAPVQKYLVDTGYTVTGAVLIPAKNEVRFYLFGGANLALVQDLVTGVWSVDTTADEPTTATAYGSGAAYYGFSNVAVIVDSSAVFTDLGNTNTVLVDTPWIKLAELKGYARFYRIQGVGETVGAHTLNLALYKNFDGSAPFASFTVTPGTLWDWELRYGAKHQALKARLSYAAANAGPKMSAIVIEYGVENARMQKGPSSKRAA